jgi:20S proteasome subunit beta 4
MEFVVCACMFLFFWFVIRNELAQALRSNPFQVSLLIGGFDEGKGPGLYYMDYMASMQKVDKAAHGYCSYFCLRYVENEMREGN